MTTGDRERYLELKELFDRATGLDGEELRRFMDEHCPDAGLRGDLECLLRADRAGGGAFGTEAPVRADASPGPHLRGLPERMGRYRILHRLGEGGMGSVFAAEQDHPRRAVALKVMHVGLLTPAMQRRFEYEGEVLARLAHQGIAHVYEAGTAEVGGVTLPFFAMELVNGVPITRFAEDHRLGLRERLELVARVADAADHAHHMGVIHRDLKPQNILVAEGGQPKILDFGIARATQEDDRSDTLRTRSGMLVGTLAYMSPEQAGGDPRALDTRSDVYALGVLAYELLTGRLPLDLSQVSIASAARIIGEEEPVRPSTLDHRLRGDVETILLKALEKDKTRRYPSAAALASDLRAYLGHEPIAARPATTLYQVRKFARRNPGLVAGVAATFLALAIGLVVSLEYYQKSERARIAAEQSTQAEARARKRSDSIKDYILEEMFAAPDPWAPQGKDVTVATMLDRISDRVTTSFADDPELEADAQATLGGSYLARGMVDRAAVHAGRALELRRKLHASDDLDLADSLLLGARLHSERGDLEAARQDALEAVAMYERITDAPREKLADARRALARVQLAKGEHDEALKGFQGVLEMRRALHGPVHELVAQALADLLAVHTAMGHTDEAVRLGRENLALRRVVHGADSPHVALSMVDLAAVLFEEKTREADVESIDLQRQAVAIDEKRLGPEHRLTLLARRSLANSLVRVDQKEEAEQILRAVTDALPRVIGEEHEDFVQTLNSYGYLLFLMDRTDEAEAQYRRAVAIAEKAFGPAHDNTLRPLANLGYLEKDRGFSQAQDKDGDGFPDVEPGSDLDHSIEHLRAVLKGFEGLYGPNHEHTSNVVYALADTFYRLGRYAEAAPLFQRRARTLELNKPPEYEQTITRILMLEGSAHVKAGAPTQGEEPLRESVRRCRGVFPPDDWRTALCESALGDCLTRIGKAGEAETVLLESLAALEPLRDQRKRDFAQVLGRLADACEAQGKSALARSYRERL